MDLPLKITDKALQEIIKIKTTKQIPEEYGLRIGIKGAGCAGVSYLLGFDKFAQDDGAFDLDGIKIFISKKHTMYVIGLVLDFYEGPESRGFMFSSAEQKV